MATSGSGKPSGGEAKAGSKPAPVPNLPSKKAGKPSGKGRGNAPTTKS